MQGHEQDGPRAYVPVFAQGESQHFTVRTQDSGKTE